MKRVKTKAERRKRRIILSILFIVSCLTLLAVYWQWQYKSRRRPEPIIFASERTVTLIEGWTMKEMGEYLVKEGVFKEGEFIKAVEKVKLSCQLSVVPAPEHNGRYGAGSCQLVNALPKKATTLEGYLFPDTYRLYLDAKPEDLVEKMLENFQRKISNQNIQNNLQLTTYNLHEVVTMASIVEAEVPHAEDRPVIAGIFWKRLEAGIPLQADSTVNYITGKRERAATLADTKIDSPYNTYLYPDLPPGPIGNPGLKALQAVLAPQESPYWYFLSKEDGTTVFSQTLEAHNLAKRKYLK